MKVVSKTPLRDAPGWRARTMTSTLTLENIKNKFYFDINFSLI